MQISVEKKEKTKSVIVELSSQEKVDTYGYGVLANNKFENVANIYERQMNDRRVLLYRDLPIKNIKIWLQEKVNEFSLLTMLRSITEVTTSISTFSLYIEGLLMDVEYVFVTDKGTAKFIYIPIEGMQSGNTAIDLIRDILESADPKTETCAEYIHMISALYENKELQIEQIKELVDKLSGREEKTVSAPKEVSETAIPGVELPDKRDHSTFVMRERMSGSKPGEKKSDSNSAMENSDGKSSSFSKKAATDDGRITAPGGFLIPGIEQSSMGNERKKKSKKSDSQSLSDSNGETAKKKRMNLTEMLIAWIKKLKAKKASDNGRIDMPQETPKRSQKIKKSPKMPDGNSVEKIGLPAVPDPREQFRSKVTAEKKATPIPSSPELTSASKKVPAPKVTEKAVSNPPKREEKQKSEEHKKEDGLTAVVGQAKSNPQSGATSASLSGSASDVAVQTNKSNGNIQIIVNLPANQGQANVTDYINQLRPKLMRESTGEVIVVDRAVFKIGKEKGYVNYYISDNPHISRAHATILSKEGKYYIVDTNSTNHTYVNGTLCESNVEVELTNKDVIRFANEDFVFLCQE